MERQNLSWPGATAVLLRIGLVLADRPYVVRHLKSFRIRDPALPRHHRRVRDATAQHLDDRLELPVDFVPGRPPERRRQRAALQLGAVAGETVPPAVEDGAALREDVLVWQAGLPGAVYLPVAYRPDVVCHLQGLRLGDPARPRHHRRVRATAPHNLDDRLEAAVDILPRRPAEPWGHRTALESAPMAGEAFTRTMEDRSARVHDLLGLWPCGRGTPGRSPGTRKRPGHEQREPTSPP